MRCRRVLHFEETVRRQLSSFRSVLLPPVHSWVYKEAGEHETSEWSGTFWTSCVAAPDTLRPVSPWHDLPWSPSSALRAVNPPGPGGEEIVCVVEIPQGSLAKLEMDKSLPFNPIVQDVHSKKPGKPLRFLLYAPETGVPFHYGFVPRTYEDPDVVHPATALGGDGDPLDVVLLDPRGLLVPRRDPVPGQRLTTREEQAGIRGSAWRCKVLGVLPLIDDGESDFKILAEPLERLPVGATPPSAAPVNSLFRDVLDIPTPSREHLLHWFRFYKTAEKKAENEIAMGGGLQPAHVAAEIVQDCVRSYTALVGTEEGRETAVKKNYWIPKE